MFEEEFEALVRQQKVKAKGQRLDMLKKDMTGTKKMLEVIYPVIGSLEGIILEFEMISLAGVKIYGDAFIKAWKTVLEEENYITHAETVTRKRFSFERARARSVAAFGYIYFPYGKDELEQQPEACRRDLQALIYSNASNLGSKYLGLSVLEREALRLAILMLKPFGLEELAGWLQLKKHATSKVARGLVSKGLFIRVGGGDYRCHEFAISDRGRSLLIDSPSRL